MWWVDRRDDPRLIELLSTPERRRARALRHAGARARFVTARALLRAVLADRLHRPAPSFVIETRCRACGSREHGRPEVAGLGWSVSMSHSAGRIGVAIAPSDAMNGAPEAAEPVIGLDIESVTGRTAADAQALAELALTAAERRSWQDLPGEHRIAAALGWWTRKEAVLKATGWGLAIAPGLVEVTGPFDRPAVTAWAGEALSLLGGVLPRGHLYDVHPGGGWVGSLASIGAPVALTERTGERLLDDALA